MHQLVARPPARRRRALLVLAVVLVAAWTAVTERAFLPRATAPSAELRVDAVVVLGGGPGERIAAGLALADRAAAAEVVLWNGARRDIAAEACGDATRAYSVECPRPEPDTTLGELRGTAELAREREWRSVAVVTTTYHRPRVERVLARCVTGAPEVTVLTAEPWNAAPGAWFLAAREQVALARLAATGCD